MQAFFVEVGNWMAFGLIVWYKICEKRLADVKM